MRTPSSRVLLARQPIIGRDRAVVAYELLYRSASEREGAFFIDNALATADVVDAAFRRIGIQTVVGRTRALVNVDAEFLLSRRIEQLPKETVMLELLETIDIDAQIVRRCGTLKERGYSLALDDVCRYSKAFEPLLEFVDVVKIDVVQLDARSLARLVQQLRPWPPRLLAEKVDTAAKLKQCVDLGVDWFQGFFCGRPVVLTAWMMPTVRTACRRFTDDFGLTKTLRLSRLRAREAGMVCCLAKPFAPDELLECVREALARATPKS